jgi:predicted porin
MKKLLMSAAVIALAAAAPAHAEGLKLDIGGHFKGYAVYTDQDNAALVTDDLRQLDFRKETELHFSGEVTLDNGLTVGAHFETDADIEENGSLFEESYLYMSGGWGRVNFGEEDGAAFLLQVAAPSADGNIDGLRQQVNSLDLGGALAGTAYGSDRLDYDLSVSGKANKLTYFTPVFNGFQAAVTYTPTVTDDPQDNLAAASNKNNDDQFGASYEVALRYEGDFDGVGVNAGAGFATANMENNANAINVTDDLTAWNAGLDLDIGAFGVGANYSESNNGVSNNGDSDILVIGADYTTGAYKLGVSYYDRTDEANARLGVANAAIGAETDVSRLTGGVSYKYGPGMSFRGSISYIDVDRTGGTSLDGYQVAVGTQVNF